MERRFKDKSELVGGLMYTSPWWYGDNKKTTRTKKKKKSVTTKHKVSAKCQAIRKKKAAKKSE